MSIVVVTPPASLPIDAETARRRLRIDDDGEVTDDDIDLLIGAATASLDGPDGWLGRCLITQTLEMRLDQFCSNIPLPFPPFVEIDSIKYDDAAGVEQTVSPATYRLVGGARRPRLILSSGSSWPTTNGQSECIRIQYVCGYGDAEAVPAPIRQAIILMVRDLYSLGERNLFTSSETVDGVGSAQFVVSDNAARVMRSAAENLLSTFQVYG